MTDAVDQSPCPACGEPVPVTLTTDDPAEQLAPEAVECPNCGASLVRAVSGPVDAGWRVVE
jgi:hypothetical protein